MVQTAEEGGKGAAADIDASAICWPSDLPSASGQAQAEMQSQAVGSWTMKH